MTLYQVPQGRTLSCKQLRNPKRHGALKNRNGQTLMHMTVGVNEEHLLASLVDAGVSVTAVNARGETGWQAFVRAWVVRYHKTPLFYLALKSFIARLGASVDVTCESRCESTLHRYGEHLVASKVIRRSHVNPGLVQVSMPGADDDSIRCLFLLLKAGCRVNALDKLQHLPFQTSVFGEPNSNTAIPLLGEMWKMLAAAGSRLQLSFNETQKLAIFFRDFTTEKSDDLLSFRALGLLTAHSDAAKAILRVRIKTPSICDDVIAQLCRPLTLKNLCLICIRMNCYPNAFVGSSKLPLAPALQEHVRPFYQTYDKQFGSMAPDVVVINWLDGRQTSARFRVNTKWKVGDIVTFSF